MEWENFENECVNFLSDKYGNYFELKGKTDSTVSDIYFSKNDKCFFIEAKMPSSQCGQFVLLPDKNKCIFDIQREINQI